jgi:hypothetical protein
MGQNDLELANSKLRGQESGSASGSTVHGNVANEPSLDTKEANATNGNGGNLEKLGAYDKYELTEDDCYEELGFCFS